MTYGEFEHSIDVNAPHALSKFSDLFGRVFQKGYTEEFKHIVILCVGTDRSTGDCLGPLIGHKLGLIRYRNVFVHGTLDEPVHAKNLCETIEYIHQNYQRPFIIAIDACLGKPERIGNIVIGQGALRPGAGVNKHLPPVGHIHIVGIVNLGGFMEYLILQNTRLSLVMRMADTITNGIHYNLWKLFEYKESKEARERASVIEIKSD
ncbi:MAG: spore protease YyaC [Clostridia bacterium]